MFRNDLLAEKVILITGGGSGLGLVMARAFAAHGARLSLVSRDRGRLVAAAQELDPGGAVHVHAADVRDPAAVQAAVDSALARFGRIDVLVNNAAGNFLAATEDLSANAFDAVVRIVLHGTFHMTSAVGRHMLERGAGTILNILATYAWTGSAFVVPSAAAKAGVLAMTRSLAVEWGGAGIRVNAIAPGPIPTEGAFSRLLPTPELEQSARERIPMKRFGEPGELANLALFLVSDASPYINGECVTIDGGGWMNAGGQFNQLTRIPREELRERLRGFRR